MDEEEWKILKTIFKVLLKTKIEEARKQITKMLELIPISMVREGFEEILEEAVKEYKEYLRVLS